MPPPPGLNRVNEIMFDLYFLVGRNILSKFELPQCKHPAHSCVVGCKESRGLSYLTALTARSMTIRTMFVVFM